MLNQSNDSSHIIIEKIGSNLITSFHQTFVRDSLDNDEYLRMLKIALDSISSTSTALVSKQYSEILFEQLRKQAEDLFIEVWLKNAEEDPDDATDTKTEIKMAKKEFKENFI